MTTTRARPGSAGPAGSPSVIALRLLKQQRKTGRGELRGGGLEPFHRPRPEVEVERASRLLDGSPERPAVLGRQAEQPGPGDLAAQRPAVVRRDKLGQAALAPDVAELETGIVVAGVLVVDQPDAIAIVDEVPG